MALLEVACFSPEHALLAYEAGADRIELCNDRHAGGTTPPLRWLTAIREIITVPVFVMIRPRGGDFHYSDQEFSQMKAEIQNFKGLADGYVFGLLNGEGKVDVARTGDLVGCAHPLPCTFHRAFDDTPNAFEAFENVISAGCRAILTSGGAASALAGVETLAQLVRMSQGRVTVMPGGSVRARNIAMVKGYTKAEVFHSSGVPKGMEVPSADEIRDMKSLLQAPMAGLAPLQRPPSPATDDSADDGEAVERMQMSAVSIGASPPF
ncbi:hypothetical protein LTR85_007350 [Meristemomyces frigidus]|nr:hypothetical protein LTR85_007350 [Meristemomyces frigidus]